MTRYFYKLYTNLIMYNVQIDEEVGKWSLPCVTVGDPFIIRDKAAYGEIRHMEPLLDELDLILAVISS